MIIIYLKIYLPQGSSKALATVTSVIDGTGSPVTFTITRTGSLSGSLTVNWTTADDTAIDVDLFLLDSHGAILKKDTEPDATPCVVYHTQRGEIYGMRTKMCETQGKKASLVLTATLEFEDRK